VIDDVIKQLHVRAASVGAHAENPRELRARLASLMSWLDGEPTLKNALKSLQGSAFALLDEFDRHQRALALRIDALRIRIEDCYPRAEDPRALRPASDDRGEAALKWMFSLGRFEDVLEDVSRVPMPPTFPRHEEEDTCQVELLLKILRYTLARLEGESKESGVPDVGLREFESERAELAGEHQRVKRAFDDAVLVGAPCALLRLRRLSSDDSLPGWPEHDRRQQQWVTALVQARYGKTAPHYLAALHGLLPAGEKQEHDREQLLDRIREDIERVITEVEARSRELARFGGVRGWPFIGPVARALSNPRPPAGVSLVTSIIVALVTYVLVDTNPFSGGATPWNTRVADICDSSNRRMASVEGESSAALAHRATISVSTFYELERVVTSSPPYQRTNFERYVHDRWAIGKVRLEVAHAAQLGQSTARFNEPLQTLRSEAEFDARNADLAVCGEGGEFE
jgi:hypothetical protein